MAAKISCFVHFKVHLKKNDSSKTEAENVVETSKSWRFRPLGTIKLQNCIAVNQNLLKYFILNA